jgi:drug/metabolite transporter (DMT)-like permease
VTLGRTILLTSLALVAFAGNSILCRMALSEEVIDPVPFTALRLTSGALVLLPFLRRRAGEPPEPWSARGAFALFAYALFFSLAYVTLDTGTGALLLFGAVQVTMLLVGRLQGERWNGAQLLGIAAAMAGVVHLVSPGVTAPDPLGALAMTLAGVAWGAYSILGRSARRPAAATARNFLLALVLGDFALLFAHGGLSYELHGVLLAVASGALTSGIGYVLWYACLAGHTTTSAAVVQLVVPALAALGGVLLLDEALTQRLVLSGALTLGGVYLTVRARGPRR